MSALTDLGRRLDGLTALIRSKHPQDEWILIELIPIFVQTIQSGTTPQEEQAAIFKINKLIDTYNWRFGSTLEEQASFAKMDFYAKELRKRVTVMKERRLANTKGIN